jgi:hypothetical protein
VAAAAPFHHSPSPGGLSVVDRVGASATALDLTGAGSSLPLWAAAVLAALVIIAGIVAFARNGLDGVSASLMQGAVVLMVALAGWWAIDHFARRDFLAERQALDARAFELTARAMTPGSALACLDAMAGDVVEDACEKALFASPEAAAAAVSYVAAQLSLLASAGDHARRAGPGSAMMQLRHALEADPFGVVAQVLAVRDGCTPAQCGAFALLQDTRRISANLAERPFEARLKQYAASWPASGGRPVASTPTPAAAPQPTAAAGPRVPNNLYFPSASSIPPVNIMTAEPAAPQPPRDTTGAAADTSARKPAAGAAPARQPPSSASAPARSTPTPLAPPQ